MKEGHYFHYERRKYRAANYPIKKSAAADQKMLKIIKESSDITTDQDVTAWQTSRQWEILPELLSYINHFTMP